jgi:hypothetical protein
MEDKAEWIAGYVARAKAVGFHCEATEDGCIYREGWGVSEFVVRVCDCGCNSWGMFPRGDTKPGDDEATAG